MHALHFHPFRLEGRVKFVCYNIYGAMFHTSNSIPNRMWYVMMIRLDRCLFADDIV